MYIDLHVTEFCNLRCKHCYLSNDYFSHNLEMDFSTYCDLIDNFKTMKHPSSKRAIILSGGECTSHSKIEDMIKYVHFKYDSRIAIVTNGFKIPELVEKEVFWKSDGISLSIDGDKQMHEWLRGNNSFEILKRALDALKGSGLCHNLHMTIHKGNLHTIKKVCDFAKQYDIGYVGASFFHPIQKSFLEPVTLEEYWGAVEELQKNFPNHNYNEDIPCYTTNKCHAGIHSIAVLPDGTYWDCTKIQTQIGKYPDKIENSLYKYFLLNNKYNNPREMCMKCYKGKIYISESIKKGRVK